MKSQLESLQSQYRIYIHKLNSSHDRYKQIEYQDELSRIRKEIEDLESADRAIDEERKRQSKFELNVPPKVQDKYKREDTRYHPKILNNNVSNRNEYGEEFYNNAARNIPIIPKPNKVPKYLIIFLLLVSFIFICIGLNIDFSNIIHIGLFILLFIILPIYIILKNIDSIIYAIKGIIKFVLFYGCIFIILIFIYNSLHYVGEQTSVIDSILKPIGIKEYTHEELVNKVKINTDDNHLIDVIKSALFNTDNNTLKYIKSISVVSRDKVSEICKIEVAMGCADMTYKDKRIYDANIYLSNLSGYIGMCGSFSHSLYHEIGHVNYVSNNNYIDYTHIQYELRPDEIYADDYANKHTIDKGLC